MRQRTPRDADQRVRRDVLGEGEAVAGRVHESARELFALGEGERVDEDVEAVVRLRPPGEDPLDVLVSLDVTGLDKGRADRRGERPDALLDQRFNRREADL